MLAKHYYQASHAWVVFFVPETDAELGFYNEFMHYLEEKQRATVSRLDEKNTLFLVPPSEFSEKVLKVPGRLSISGVVLRLDHGGDSYVPRHADERKDISMLSYQANTSPYTMTPSEAFPSAASLRNPSIPGNVAMSARDAGSVLGHASGGAFDSNSINRFRTQENPRFEPDWSSNSWNELSGARHTSAQASYSPSSSSFPDSRAPGMPPQGNSNHFAGHSPGIAFPGDGRPPSQVVNPSTSSLPLPLPQDQLLQLASSVFAQQRQLDSTSKVTLEDPRRSNITYQPSASQQYDPLNNNQATYEPLPSNFGQVQLQQQQMSGVPAAPQTAQSELQLSQQMQAAEATEGGDPHKRLQATLQLAAALLQQVQGKRT